jgi:hypothetical protein
MDLLPKLRGAQTPELFENFTEVIGVLIAHGIGDFLDAFP